MMKHSVLIVTSLLLAPLQLFANDWTFVPLSPELPVIGKASSLTGLLNDLLGISIAVAAILAVVMFAIGGFKYMTQDSAFAMGNAKEQMSNAIIGLLIVLMTILILKEINPKLVSLDIFKPIPVTTSN